MSLQKRRIEKIESSLTPKQAVLLWLTEAHSHGSFGAYVLWLKEQPETAYPLARLPRQVREAVKAAMRGASGVRGEVHRPGGEGGNFPL